MIAATEGTAAAVAAAVNAAAAATATTGAAAGGRGGSTGEFSSVPSSSCWETATAAGMTSTAALASTTVPSCAVEWQGDSFQPLEAQQGERRAEKGEEDEDEEANWGWLFPKVLLRRKSSRIVNTGRGRGGGGGGGGGRSNSTEHPRMKLAEMVKAPPAVMTATTGIATTSFDDDELEATPPPSLPQPPPPPEIPPVYLRPARLPTCEVLRETQELDRILSVTDREDRNWVEASVSLSSCSSSADAQDQSSAALGGGGRVGGGGRPHLSLLRGNPSDSSLSPVAPR